MVVIVIIAVMATIAVPLFSARLRSRHLLQVAGRLADVYRGARTRALARGAAVTVSLNVANGSFQVLEGVMGTTAATNSGHPACGNLPGSGCLTNNWGNVGSGTTVGTARVVEGVTGTGVAGSMTLPDGTTQTSGTIAVCFSPAGRAYYNKGSTWTPETWQTLGSVAVLDLTSTDPNNQTTRDYSIIIMPNGTARLAP